MPISNNKKQSRLARIARGLNPNTPKKKLLTFIFAFAFVGGGFMVYNSFAATNAVFFNVDQMWGGVKVWHSSGGQSNKANQYVRLLQKGESAFINYDSNVAIWARNVRFCAYVKSNIGHNWIEVRSNAGPAYSEYVTESQQFRRICTGWFANPSNTFRHGGSVKHNGSISSGTAITVSSMSVEYY